MNKHLALRRVELPSPLSGSQQPGTTHVVKYEPIEVADLSRRSPLLVATSISIVVCGLKGGVISISMAFLL